MGVDLLHWVRLLNSLNGIILICLVVAIFSIWYKRKVISPRGDEHPHLTHKEGMPFVLQKKNKELTDKVLYLRSEVAQLEKVLEDKNAIIREYVRKEKEGHPIADKNIEEKPGVLDERREKKKKMIGEILLENKLITSEILNKAIKHQKESGGSITQYLLHYGFIDERHLAQCLSSQFEVPYLPVTAYDISDDVIKLVPVDIAEKYWLIPVDKRGDTLIVAMIDPLDRKVITELEKHTGLNVIPFVGIISEISEALRNYYKVSSIAEKTPSFFIETRDYKGLERRASIRYAIELEVHFPVEGYYKKSKTFDISRDGFAFESELIIPVGTVLMLEITLACEYSPLPISAITKVVRCVRLQDNKFEIGVKTLKIAPQDIEIIINYASVHSKL
jgi:hypothetical protein